MIKILMGIMLFGYLGVSAHATIGMPKKIKIKGNNLYASPFTAMLDEIDLSKFELHGSCKTDDPDGLNWQLYAKYMGKAILSWGSVSYRLESAKVLQILGTAQANNTCKLDSLADLQQILPQVLVFQNVDFPKEKLVMIGYVDESMRFVPERIREFNKPSTAIAFVELLETY